MWERYIGKEVVSVGFLTLLFSKLYVRKEELYYEMHASGDGTWKFWLPWELLLLMERKSHCINQTKVFISNKKAEGGFRTLWMTWHSDLFICQMALSNIQPSSLTEQHLLGAQVRKKSGIYLCFGKPVAFVGGMRTLQHDNVYCMALIYSVLSTRILVSSCF